MEEFSKGEAYGRLVKLHLVYYTNDITSASEDDDESKDDGESKIDPVKAIRPRPMVESSMTTKNNHHLTR